MRKVNQQGFHIAELTIVLIVFGIVGLVGWKVMGRSKTEQSTPPTEQFASTQKNSKPEATKQDVTWMWNDTAWAANATAPACSEPLRFSKAPSDLSKATGKLYPGESRGGNYKPHGGLAYDNNTDNKVSVVAIMDGDVTSGARYIEGGEVQYMFWIENDCGIAYRFDHLLTLSPKLQAVADTLPEPKPDDSRTTNFAQPIHVKTGDEIATAVGHTKPKLNVGYDLGVYDLRKPNAKGSDAAYRAAHQAELSQAAYALCWFDMFSSQDSARLQSLPIRGNKPASGSDYCSK